MTDESANDLVTRLRGAFTRGVTRPLSWRRQQLRALRRLLVDGGDELVAALRQDLGRPWVEAQVAELSMVDAEVSHALRNLRRWTRPKRVPAPIYQQPARASVVSEPLGVVLVLAPWNYPVQLSLTPLVAAIAAGDCAVLKPSEYSPATSTALRKLVASHLDPDCIAVREGGVGEATALLGQRFDHILFTGSEAVGRDVMRAAAQHLTPVTLELGGKSPCIVDADIDLEVTARRIVWGRFVNAGQTCVAPDYVLVAESREADLIDAMRRAVVDLYGEDPRGSADFGRVVHARHFDRLVGLLRDGEVVCGGQHDRDDLYIAPTVLRRVAPGARIMREEIFGPILPVIPVADIEAAIAFVNARPKPLALYVFTRRREVADRVIGATSSGGVCVNATLWQAASPYLPFGGVGASGMGAYHGRAGFDAFSHRRAIVRKPTWFDPALAYPPFTPFKARWLRRLVGGWR